MARLKKWTPVIVEWEDAHTIYEQANSEELIANHKPWIRRTIGFLIASNKSRGVTVAMEDDRETPNEDDCQTVTTIPAKMIKKIVSLVDLEGVVDGVVRHSGATTKTPTTPTIST